MPQITVTQENYERLGALAKSLRKPFAGPDDALDHLFQHYKGPGLGPGPQPPQRGGHLTDADVFEPLLRVLHSAGNNGMRPKDAVMAVEPLLGSKITDWDRQPEPSGMIHWHHRVYAAKDKLMRRGYIVAYGRTKWAITPDGVKALMNKAFGP